MVLHGATLADAQLGVVRAHVAHLRPHGAEVGRLVREEQREGALAERLGGHRPVERVGVGHPPRLPAGRSDGLACGDVSPTPSPASPDSSCPPRGPAAVRPARGAGARARRGRPDAALPGLRPRPRPGGPLVGDARRRRRPRRERPRGRGARAVGGDRPGRDRRRPRRPAADPHRRARLQRQGRRPGRGVLRGAGAGLRGRHHGAHRGGAADRGRHPLVGARRPRHDGG